MSYWCFSTWVFYPHVMRMDPYGCLVNLPRSLSVQLHGRMLWQWWQQSALLPPHLRSFPSPSQHQLASSWSTNCKSSTLGKPTTNTGIWSVSKFKFFFRKLIPHSRKLIHWIRNKIVFLDRSMAFQYYRCCDPQHSKDTLSDIRFGNSSENRQMTHVVSTGMSRPCVLPVVQSYWYPMSG